MQNRCTTCPRPVPDVAYGCAYCATDLAQRLDQLAAVLPEIAVTVSRQDRMTAGGVRSAGAEVPLPYRDLVADRGRALQGELVTWARLVLAETGRPLTGTTGSALCRYLGEAVGWARYQQHWPEYYATLRPLFGRTLGLIDRPADRVYLGPCRSVLANGETCYVDVLARPGAATGTCRECGAVHDVGESREWLLASLIDVLLRPAEIATLLRGFGDSSVGYSTIAAYVASGQVLAHGEDGRGRATFRVGDVLDVRTRLRRRSTRRGEVLAS
jgi:hypothetical protein